MVAGRLVRTAATLPPQGTTVTLAVRPEKLRFLQNGEAGRRRQRPARPDSRDHLCGFVSSWILNADDGTS